jgi:hypothetical protein
MGYIVFKYIINNDEDLEGTYCILMWMDYDESEGTAMIAVACENNPGDVGEATQEDAEDEYLGDDFEDYFWFDEYELDS